MASLNLSRRHFTSLLGAGVGGALAAPALAAQPAAAPAPAAAKGVGAGAGPIRLDSNENPYGPSAAARKAIRDSEELYCRYPDDLEVALIETLARQHKVKPSQVILGCGSSEILHLADRAFLSMGQKIVAADPTFEAVLDYSNVMKAERVSVPLDAKHCHDLPRMAAACDERTGMVYICNPNNPTATVVGGDALEDFMQRIPKTTIALIDEAYHHFVEDTSYRSAIDMIERFPNVVVARTFSKIYGMAGLRLGYAIGSEEAIGKMRANAFISNTNLAVLKAAQTSLDDAALVPALAAEFSATKRRLYAALKAQKRSYIPSETNFVMIHIGKDVGPLIEAFKARGMRVGRRFPAMPEYLRISIGMPHEMDTFARLLGELAPVTA